MNLPQGAVVRREHKLTDAEVKKLEGWLETKRIAKRRMTESHKRYSEADAIFTGVLAEKKWDLGWQDADNVVYDGEEGKMLDVVPGVDEDGKCLGCGEVHDDDEQH